MNIAANLERSARYFSDSARHLPPLKKGDQGGFYIKLNGFIGLELTQIDLDYIRLMLKEKTGA